MWIYAQDTLPGVSVSSGPEQSRYVDLFHSVDRFRSWECHNWSVTWKLLAHLLDDNYYGERIPHRRIRTRKSEPCRLACLWEKPRLSGRVTRFRKKSPQMHNLVGIIIRLKIRELQLSGCNNKKIAKLHALFHSSNIFCNKFFSDLNRTLINIES